MGMLGWVMKRISGFVMSAAVSVCAVGCGGDDLSQGPARDSGAGGAAAEPDSALAAPPRPPEQGTERGPCYPNGTCNAGLTCLSEVCVDAGLELDAATDTPSPADAGSSSTRDAALEAGVTDAMTFDAETGAEPDAKPDATPQSCGYNLDPLDTTDHDADGSSVADGDCNDCDDSITPGNGCP